MDDIRKNYFVYVVDKVLTSGQDIEAQVRISNANAFVVKFITGSSTSTFQLNIRDSGTQKNWFDSLANDINIITNYSNTTGATKNTAPYYLTVTRKIMANATLFVRLKDTSSAGNTIQILFHGYEIPA